MKRRTLLAMMACGIAASQTMAQIIEREPRPLSALVRSSWTEAELSGRSEDGRDSLNVEQGSRIQIRISGNQRMHLAVILQNPEGQLRVMVPHREDTEDLLIPGTDMLLPDTAAGEVLFADMNPGRGAVYLVGTRNPVFNDRIVVGRGPSPWESSEAIAEQLLRDEVGARVVSRLALFVRSPSVKEFVSSSEFVEFYTAGTRSVKNVDRGFRIGFKLDSAELDAFSMRQLEAVGKGMQDAQLQSERFVIEGHTDDTGAPDYNLDLSRRRAEAVRDFLAATMAVSRSRLGVRGLGQTQPQLEGSSEAARSQNRRVVIRRIDGAASP